MRGETAFQRAAEVRASDALQVVVQFDRPLTGLHDGQHTAADERDVGVHRRLTVAWAWNRRFAQGRGRVHAQREAAAIPLRAAATQAQAMHEARPREPMVESPIHRADRAWADAQSLPSSSSGMRPRISRSKAVVSLVIGAKLPLRYALSSAPCDGASCARRGFGSTDLLRRQRCYAGIHLEISCQGSCINVRTVKMSFRSRRHGPLRIMPTVPVRQTHFAGSFTPLAACSINAVTASRFDTYTAWLPLTSTTVEPARLGMNSSAPGVSFDGDGRRNNALPPRDRPLDDGIGSA